MTEWYWAAWAALSLANIGLFVVTLGNLRRTLELIGDAPELATLVELATDWLNTPTHDPDPWHRGHTTGMQDAARVILHHLKEGRP